MSWAAAGVAIWTITAPWVVAGKVNTTSTIVNDVVVGAVALCLALATSRLAVAKRRP